MPLCTRGGGQEAFGGTLGHAFALRRSPPGFRAQIHASMFLPSGNVLKYWWCYCERRGIIHSPGSLFDIKELLIISLLLLLSVWILHYYCVICIVNSSKVQQFQLNCTLILGFQYEITAVSYTHLTLPTILLV